MSLLIVLAAVVGSASNTPPPATPAPTAATPPATIGLANPASVACTKDGGTLTFVPDAAGNIFGICHRKDGSSCEEWALFRTGQCVLPPPPVAK